MPCIVPIFVRGDKYPYARATTATATIAAPACLSILAASLHVAPVVNTSSTSSTRASFTASGRRTRNAPRTFSNRRDGAKLAWGIVFCATPKPIVPHRNSQRFRQTVGQHLGAILSAPKPTPPEHRNRHDHVRPNVRQLAPAAVRPEVAPSPPTGRRAMCRFIRKTTSRSPEW